MKHWKIIWGILLLPFFACEPNTSTDKSLDNQLSIVDSLLQETSIKRQQVELYLRAFKQEQILELWGKAKKDDKFQKISAYSFCDFSGVLGPKRREGDRQIPEGFYHIDRFNPKSKFFLSLGLNYPNAEDRRLGHPQHPGSDIFIHGGCATVGCIPITDPKILELYALASQAKDNGQSKIPVHLFPAKMEGSQWKKIQAKHPQHQAFWESLAPTYQHFEALRQLP